MRWSTALAFIILVHLTIIRSALGLIYILWPPNIKELLENDCFTFRVKIAASEEFGDGRVCGVRATAFPYGEQGRRSFFNLISVPPLPHNGAETQSYHERKVFPYQRSELYEVIADIESYSNFVPYCTGSRILESETKQDGTTVMEAELTVGFLAFKESYVSAVTCKPHEFVKAVSSSSSPLFKTLSTSWCLRSISPSAHLATSLLESSTKPLASDTFPDQGPTLVTLDLAFAFANPMHATVSATFFGQVSKHMVKAFEQRCVALYGPRND